MYRSTRDEPSGGGAAFYITGDICEDPDLGVTCASIGTFHCWGWPVVATDPTAPAVVSQEYDLDGRGKIQLQGLEDEGPRAVVGGTGDFSEVSGEATGFDFSVFLTDGEFIATFDLEDAADDDSSDDDSSD